jgi:PPM family protein phosphatase
VTDMANETSLRSAAATHVGQVRSNNQDRYLLRPDEGLWVVADGMGGHRGGEVAAQIASDEIGTRFVDRTPEGLASAIVAANSAVFQAGIDDPDLTGMGTTVVAVAVVDEGDDRVLAIASVGDSRVYRYQSTDASLEQLTEDHSLVADMVREGSIAPEEAATHPQRNILTRVLGVYEDVRVDMLTVDAQPGDRYLLCSDGLFNEVSDARMTAVLRRLTHPGDAADELVRQAVESGGRDNVTVVVIDVVDDGSNGVRAGVTATGTREQPVTHDLAPFSGGAYADSDVDEDVDASGRHFRRGGSSDDVPGDVEGTGGGGRRRRQRRFTWRVALFVLLILGVIGGAFATIQWYGRSTYYVGFDGDDVTIFQGRPGGVLWIQPERVAGADIERIERDDLIPRDEAAVEAGHEVSSLDDAETYVSRLGTTTTTSSTTTTTSTTSTTTAPPDTTATAGPAALRRPAAVPAV